MSLRDSFIAYVADHAFDPDGGSWQNDCAWFQSRWNGEALGWSPAPSVYGPWAVHVAAASGPLDADASKAPAGAWHFWSGGHGHVGRDLIGGGVQVGMAGSSWLDVVYAPFVGIVSAPSWTKHNGGGYIGWATNYGGGRTAIPASSGTSLVPFHDWSDMSITVIKNAEVADRNWLWDTEYMVRVEVNDADARMVTRAQTSGGQMLSSELDTLDRLGQLLVEARFARHPYLRPGTGGGADAAGIAKAVRAEFRADPLA